MEQVESPSIKNREDEQKKSSQECKIRRQMDPNGDMGWLMQYDHGQHEVASVMQESTQIHNVLAQFHGKKVDDSDDRPHDGCQCHTSETLLTLEKGASDLEVYPPENFSHIAGQIYRSSFPQADSFKFLAHRLQLKTILVLLPEQYPPENIEWLSRHGVKLFHVPLSGNKEPFVNVPAHLLTQALTVALNPANQPILIHCNRGKHRTGCLVGCIRKLQNWSLSMIFDEYRRFAFPKARALDQQFIELYDDTEIREYLNERGWLPIPW